MLRRWILYLAVWLGLFVFALGYPGWFSWFALVAVTVLPLLGLLLSLPAMLLLRVRPGCPKEAEAGEQLKLTLCGVCPLPAPPWRGRIEVWNRFTDEKWKLRDGDPLPTEHAGALQGSLRRIWVLDYLGLFRLPLVGEKTFSVLVLPTPIAIVPEPELSRCVEVQFRPKTGGYAEDHEIRTYRPGDSLSQIHWKLSAKTEQLIVREPVEPQLGIVRLGVALCGTWQGLERTLGRLRWLSRRLLERGQTHLVHCAMGEGMRVAQVESEADFIELLRQLLQAPPAASTVWQASAGDAWIYRIGGETDET